MEQETRCGWCLINEPMIQYHDSEWGVPSHDDGKHFEFMLMEVMQCGLNWNMMIQKREIFRKCFCDYDFKRIAEFGEEEIAEILLVPGMIRSRRKIAAVIHNARQFMKVVVEFGSFDRYLWGISLCKHRLSSLCKNVILAVVNHLFSHICITDTRLS